MAKAVLSLILLLSILSGCTASVPCNRVYKDAVVEMQRDSGLGSGMLTIWNRYCPAH